MRPTYFLHKKGENSELKYTERDTADPLYALGIPSISLIRDVGAGKVIVSYEPRRPAEPLQIYVDDELVYPDTTRH